MDIAVEQLAAGIAKIGLHGRLDTTWSVVSELPFNRALADKRRVMVDLTGVTFLSSYAIRLLLIGAKMLEGKGGKLVVVCSEGNVAKVLKTAGTDTLIPRFATEAAAMAALQS